MDQNLHRHPRRRRHHRPHRLQSPHYRNRHQQLPTRHTQKPSRVATTDRTRPSTTGPNQTSELSNTHPAKPLAPQAGSGRSAVEVQDLAQDGGFDARSAERRSGGRPRAVRLNADGVERGTVTRRCMSSGSLNNAPVSPLVLWLGNSPGCHLPPTASHNRGPTEPGRCVRRPSPTGRDRGGAGRR